MSACEGPSVFVTVSGCVVRVEVSVSQCVRCVSLEVSSAGRVRRGGVECVVSVSPSVTRRVVSVGVGV